jgi:cytochrome c peroxidase
MAKKIGMCILAALIYTGMMMTTTKVGRAERFNIPNLFPFMDSSGFLETFNTNGDGSIDLANPFFQNLGTNGRSCGSCHQPSDGWSVSAAHVKLRFDLTGGEDPIFRTVDGSNCDHNVDVSTVISREQAYSLLINKGLIRIALRVPPNAQFDVVAVSNPYGCNDSSTLSMYRRPLPSTNLRFLSTVMFDGRESTPPSTEKITYATNPADLLFDLAHQALDATNGHAQAAVPLTREQQQEIVNFEMGLSTAQAIDFQAGFLNDDGANGGPRAISTQQFFVGINDPLGNNPFHTPFSSTIFTLFNAWSNAENSRRPSIALGEALFNSKQIIIQGVAGLNDATGIARLNGTCGTCHDAPNIGNHSFPAPLNIGVGDLSSPLNVSYLPVFTLQNKTTGAIVQTTDPGRALITGLWTDIGKVKGPILRGLSSRAPYFHNGSADTLQDVVNFYDARFNIGFTPQEKADLIAFLSSL